jgi:hypothetical protein
MIALRKAGKKHWKASEKFVELGKVLFSIALPTIL